MFTGVTGVIGISSPGSDRITSLAIETVSSAGDLGMSWSTLSGLKGSKSLAAQAALIFRLVNALVLAGS